MSAILALVAPILPAQAAEAQPARRVLIVRRAPEVDPDLAASLADEVRERWRTRGAEVEAPPPPSEPGPEVDLAARMEEAWALYHALRLTEARGLLESLAHIADRRFGEGLDADQQVDLQLLTALAHRALGEEAASEAAMGRALAMRPDLEVDARRYPPTFCARVAEVRETRPPVMAEVRVHLSPADVTFFVDGRPTPPDVTTLSLPVGRHLFLARGRHRHAAGDVIDLGPEGAELRLTLAVDASAALTDAGPPGAPLPATVREAVSFLGARATVLDLRDNGTNEIHVSLADDVTSERAELTAAELDPGRVAGELLASLLGETPRDELWPWLVGGGAAVAVIAAIVAGVVVGTTESTGWSGEAIIR